MDTKKNIEKMMEEALSSLDGNTRATPQPFLLTRIHARLSNKQETTWEKAVGFITSPAIVIAGLCLIIAVNVWVMTFNRSTGTENITEQQLASSDDLSTTTATLYDIENSEP